jgi:hypothetical protein
MSAHPGFEQFVNDDAAYLRWLQLHPNGLVINSHRVPICSYLMLHRASCSSINTPKRTNWTTTGYIKTCSTDVSALVEWARRGIGGSLKLCGMCRPMLRKNPGSLPTRQEPVSERQSAAISATELPATRSPKPEPTRRTLPPEISTGCPELDLAWRTYASMILNRSQILIPDTDDDLNWHAFLGHSIDMRGFRAAEFAGVDQLTRNGPKFVPLMKRGIGVPELASLWQILSIRDHLRSGVWNEFLSQETLSVLRSDGGAIGQSLAEAFHFFPWLKYRWSVRALLQNSEVLRPFDFSFRSWLHHECERIGVHEFPPTDFRHTVSVCGGRPTIEAAIRERLDTAFYMVGSAMSAYMLCDWQLWLWREGRTAVFATFKLDSRHEDFVKKFGKGFIPADEASFARWWLGLFPEIPPRLANECIWLAIENKLVNVRRTYV